MVKNYLYFRFWHEQENSDGKQLFKEQRINASKDIYSSELGSKYSVNLTTNYSYKFTPSFLIKGF